MLDDELDLFVFDPAVFGPIFRLDPSNLLVGHPVSFRRRTQRIEPLHPGHKRLIKSAQQLRLLRPFDRIVVHHTSDRADRQAISALQEQGNLIAVADQVVKRRSTVHIAQFQFVIPGFIQLRRIDERLRQRSNLLEIDHPAIRTDYTTRNLNRRRVTGNRQERPCQKNDRNKKSAAHVARKWFIKKRNPISRYCAVRPRSCR